MNNVISTWFTTITPFISLISTVVGACIAFLAAYATARYNKQKEYEVEKDNRNRERIERIYKLLVMIKSERSNEFTQVLQHIHHGVPFSEKTSAELPPIIELEMLVSLYFSSLEGKRVELIKVIQEFGAKQIEFRYKDYKKEPLSKKTGRFGCYYGIAF